LSIVDSELRWSSKLDVQMRTIDYLLFCYHRIGTLLRIGQIQRIRRILRVFVVSCCLCCVSVFVAVLVVFVMATFVQLSLVWDYVVEIARTPCKIVDECCVRWAFVSGCYLLHAIGDSSLVTSMPRSPRGSGLKCICRLWGNFCHWRWQCRTLSSEEITVIVAGIGLAWCFKHFLLWISSECSVRIWSRRWFIEGVLQSKSSVIFDHLCILGNKDLLDCHGDDSCFCGNNHSFDWIQVVVKQCEVSSINCFRYLDLSWWNWN